MIPICFGELEKGIFVLLKFFDAMMIELIGDVYRVCKTAVDLFRSIRHLPQTNPLRLASESE